MFFFYSLSSLSAHLISHQKCFLSPLHLSPWIEATLSRIFLPLASLFKRKPILFCFYSFYILHGRSSSMVTKTHSKNHGCFDKVLVFLQRWRKVWEHESHHFYQQSLCHGQNEFGDFGGLDYWDFSGFWILRSEFFYI